MIFCIEKPEDFNSISNVYDNSIDQLTIKCLDLLPEKKEILTFCNKKLAKEGTIEIIGHDLIEIARDVYSRRIKAPEVHKYIEKYIVSVFDIVEILENLNIRILEKRVNYYQYYIKGIR